ncbi:hypothetical protein HGRIS_006262 [Hohenbuehelia grisea]|uniref:N-acetyltransferase domain-containing protein n=1 Tax=Hohenbuehelia grisea TaxID=104357 RepID=A0ABR3K236_9AGAR
MPPGPVNLSECIATINLVRNSRQPLHFTIDVSYPGYEGYIATLSGSLIDRYACSSHFHLMMERDSEESFIFGTTLFDRCTRLHPWLRNNGFHRGSGCWGLELNHGGIIYVQDINVQSDLRNQGIGSWTLQQLFSSILGAKDHVYCWPSPTESHPAGDHQTLFKQLLSFFRQNGFRRIGLTQFFAYSPKNNHPSRLIPPTNDIDPEETNGIIAPQASSAFEHFTVWTRQTLTESQIILFISL